MSQRDEVLDVLEDGPSTAEELLERTSIAKNGLWTVLRRMLRKGLIEAIPAQGEGYRAEMVYWRHDTEEDLVDAVDRAGACPIEHLHRYSTSRFRGRDAPDPVTPVERVSDQELMEAFEMVGDLATRAEGFDRLDRLLTRSRRPRSPKQLDALLEYARKEPYRDHWAKVLTIARRVLVAPQQDWEEAAQDDLVTLSASVLEDAEAPVRARAAAYWNIWRFADAERASDIFRAVLEEEVVSGGRFIRSTEGRNLLSRMTEELTDADRQELLTTLRDARDRGPSEERLSSWIQEIQQGEAHRRQRRH